MGKKTPAQRLRATELRRNEKNARRQAYFIADYVQVKYFNIYCEAARFFNALNTLYPTKYDIRKTSEYRTWRAEFTTGQRLTKAQPPSYRNINVPMDFQNPDQSQSPENGQSSQPQSPQNEDQLPESEPESPENGQSSQPQIPQNEDQLPESEPESPENGQSSQPQSPQNEDQLPESEPESPENSQSSQPQSPQNDEQPWKDNMELKIPLLEYKPSTPSKSARTITTQTIEIITDQTLEQSNIQNNPLNQLSDASINEIIRELRQDPELQNMFDEMDFSEGIDINEDIRLENELLNW